MLARVDNTNKRSDQILSKQLAASSIHMYNGGSVIDSGMSLYDLHFS